MKILKKKDKEQCKYSEYLSSLLAGKENSTHPEPEAIDSKCGKRYCDNIRRCVYTELLCDVPVKHCGFLLKRITEVVTGKHLQNVPSPSTGSQMAYELGILATLQVMEFMMKERALCLSWDATTIEGAHINEIHVTANKTNCLVLDVQHLPGGTSADYVTHIVGSLSEAASLYAKFKGCSENDIFHSLKERISSTLTDRAAVNAAVTRQLCIELDSELLKLNCNVHPLDSVARDVKTVLCKLDLQHEIQGQCYGCEGAAANLIKAISILRYKDGKGDPVGFKNFLRQKEVPVGAFPRYVGNRLHVLFHLAGVLKLYEAQLLDFVEKQCTAAGLLRSKILSDLKNKKVMQQVWLLAGIGKTFSGPWMSKFYSGAMSNLEMAPLIQCCVSKVQTWIEDPDSFIHLEVNVFNEPLDPLKDDVLSALQNLEIEFDDNDRNYIIGLSKSVLSSVLAVLSRQLSDFVDGIFSQPSQEMIDRTVSAPTHNMSSERTLGSLDRMLRRAPIATMGFLNGKVKTKMNKTLQWLENKPLEEQALVNFVSLEARQLRGKKALEDKELNSEISKRRCKISSQRAKSKKNSIVRDLNKTFNKTKPLNTDYEGGVERHIINYIDSPESVIGMLFIHMQEGGEIEKYGRIQRPKKGNKLVIAYWNLGEMEASSCDYTISASSFFADLVLGHIIIM